MPRPARLLLPPPEPAVVRIAAPPTAPPCDRVGLGQALLAAVGSLGTLGFALVSGNRLFLLLAGVLLLATVGGGVGSRLGQRRVGRRRRAELAARWSAHLAERAAAAAAAATTQRVALAAVHPDTALVAARARGAAGLWERRRGDADAWRVRVGTGPVPARVTLVAEGLDAPLAEHDQGMAAAAAAAVAAAGELLAAPVVVDLAAVAVLAIVGPVVVTRACARALLLELVVSRPPGELGVAVATDDPAAWQWLVWLPHRHRLLAPGARARSDELVVVDGDSGAGADAAPRGAAAVVWLAATAAEVPGDAGLVLTLAPEGERPSERGHRFDGGHLSDGRRLDTVAGADEAGAEEVARALCPLRPAPGTVESSAVEAAVGDVRLMDLLDVSDPARLDARARWRGRPAAGRLRVPLGVDEGGRPVVLDLRESAEGGSGPHGLLVGATGSGKSELLRSMVLGLALDHAPAELAMVLVDWKGGAAFDDVSELPHVAGLVTNLADDPTLVARVGAALRGELARRQRVLRAAGAESLRSYSARRAAGESLPALPSLLVVVDEFGELLAAEPDLLDVFVAVGRQGRSLGVHLLLSSQRLEEGRLRGLEGHLRYRICLRVFTPAESQAVLGVVDAAALPATPGAGLLAVDGTRVRLHAAHTCTPAVEPPTLARALVQPLRLGGPDVPGAYDAPGAPPPGESVRAVVVRQILQAGAERVAPVWLPPLAPVVDLLGLLGGSHRRSLRLPVARADSPARQAQPTWTYDLAMDGHLAVVAAPGAGASTLMLALGTAAAALHAPDELQLAALDLGGGRLTALDRLPHTRCVAGIEGGPALLRSLRRLLVERTATAREHGLDSAQAWRAARADGRLAGVDAADVLVIIDGFGRAREELPDLDDELAALAAGGLRIGLHLAVAATRWAELRPALRELLATRLELRLADAADSALRHGVAACLTGAPPGRGLSVDGVLLQVGDPADLPARLAARAPAAVCAPRLLPLPVRVEHPDPAVVGIREGDAATVRWEPLGCLLVLGDRGSGRSTLLRRLVGAAAGAPASQQVLVVDPRRSLLAACGRPGVLWTGGGLDTEQAVAHLAAELAARLPQPGARPEDVLAGRFWAGPRHLVVVDDAELLPGGALGGPLTPLASLLRRAEDVGLGLGLARGVRGWARSAYDPLLLAVQEAGPAAALLSGDPAEGPLLRGRRAAAGRPAGRATWLAVDEPAVEVQLVAEPESLPRISHLISRRVA